MQTSTVNSSVTVDFASPEDLLDNMRVEEFESTPHLIYYKKTNITRNRKFAEFYEKLLGYINKNSLHGITFSLDKFTDKETGEETVTFFSSDVPGSQVVGIISNKGVKPEIKFLGGNIVTYSINYNGKQTRFKNDVASIDGSNEINIDTNFDGRPSVLFKSNIYDSSGNLVNDYKIVRHANGWKIEFEKKVYGYMAIRYGVSYEVFTISYTTRIGDIHSTRQYRPIGLENIPNSFIAISDNGIVKFDLNTNQEVVNIERDIVVNDEIADSMIIDDERLVEKLTELEPIKIDDYEVDKEFNNIARGFRLLKLSDGVRYEMCKTGKVFRAFPTPIDQAQEEPVEPDPKTGRYDYFDLVQAEQTLHCIPLIDEEGTVQDNRYELEKHKILPPLYSYEREDVGVKYKDYTGEECQELIDSLEGEGKLGEEKDKEEGLP